MTWAMTIASRWASRGSTGTPRACSRALSRYSICARKASLTQASRSIWAGRVQPRAELVALAAVHRGHPGVLDQRPPRRGWRARSARPERASVDRWVAGVAHRDRHGSRVAMLRFGPREPAPALQVQLECRASERAGVGRWNRAVRVRLVLLPAGGRSERLSSSRRPAEQPVAGHGDAAARPVSGPAPRARAVRHAGLTATRVGRSGACTATAAASGAWSSVSQRVRSATSWHSGLDCRRPHGRGAAGADRARAARADAERCPGPRTARVPGWRSRWPPTTRRSELLGPPARLDPRPDPPQLGVRDQR